MKKSFVMGAALLLATAVFAADKVIDLSSPAAWNGKVVLANKDGSVSVKSVSQITAKELIPVDGKHTYDFSGTAYCPAGKIAGMSYAGFLLYDKNKQFIAQVFAVTAANSQTELTEAVKKGSSVLKIKANKAWKPFGHYRAAFNFVPGKLCREISSGRIKSIKTEGNVMVVTMSAPIRKDYPAGTKVRIQATGSYFYSSVFSVKNKPVNFSKKLKQGNFWVETAYIRPMILVNWSLSKNVDKSKLETVYKDIKLTVKEIK